MDAALVRHLRAAGHDVSYVAEDRSGAVDTDVLRRAHEEDRVLLTEDKDFGELIFRSRMPVPGVVLMRLGPEDRQLKWPRFQAAMEQFGRKLSGRITDALASATQGRAVNLLQAVRP